MEFRRNRSNRSSWNDARLQQTVWVKCITQQAAGQRKHVGPGTRLVRGPRMVEDNTGWDLAQLEPLRAPQTDEEDGGDEDMHDTIEA